ncbi:MAG: hypothetical protein ACO1OO_08555 [Flavisolibacter sp.]
MTNEDKIDQLMTRQTGLAAFAANMLLQAISGMKPLPDEMVQYFETGKDPVAEVKEYYQREYGIEHPRLIRVNGKYYLLNGDILHEHADKIEVWI